MSVKLFTESAYSFSGATIMPKDIIDHALAHGFSYVVLADKNAHAFYKFYQMACKNKLKVILGLQVRIEPLFKKTPLNLVCYAKNQQGYQDLLMLASLQAVYKEIEYSAFKKYANNISVVINTNTGEWHELDQEGSLNAIKTWLETLRQDVDDVYLGQGKTNNDIKLKVPKLSFQKTAIKHAEDQPVYETLAKILQAESHHNVAALEDNEDELTKEKQVFLEKHSLDLTFNQASLPKFETPDKIDSKRYLKALSYKGLAKRLSGKNVDKTHYEKRLDKELRTIDELGFNDYFLIMWDVIKYAKKERILVGPGRGSAPGSLVSYALGITSIDPVTHGLLFERFLNKARKTMPDIDIDFPDHKRDQVVRYVKDRYGAQYVALICTFGTFLSKSALRDSARVLKIESRYVEEMARKITSYPNIQAMIKGDADVRNRMDNESSLAAWLSIAQKLENLPRHVSTHAAGVMLSEEPLIEYTAIQEGLNTLYQTQYEQTDLEAMGLLKMDFLGLRNLTMIEDVIVGIKRTYNKTIDVAKLPLDDKKTFKLLREKSTTGLFQLESSGMRSLIKRMKMRAFEDIVAVLALYRPGPMEQIPSFLKRRHGKEKVQPITEEVDQILAPTHGILLYQEQIMAIAVQFANYTLIEADLLRRAVSKKDSHVLKAERSNFVKHAKNAGKSQELADKIYDYIVKFADYGFNKSHSVAYAMIAYWMAYLKANYPAMFLSVLMQNALNNDRLLRLYTQELHEHGLSLQKPSLEKSKEIFTLEKDHLYYPLSGIKFIGKQTVMAYLDMRDSVSFESFIAFVKDTKEVFNKRHYEMLIKSGACDEFRYNKKTMLKNLEAMLDFLAYDTTLALDEFIYQNYDEFDRAALKTMEHETLGFNITYDSFKPFENVVQQEKLSWPFMLEDFPPGRFVDMIGLLVQVKEITTKQGKPMAFLSFEDRVTTMEAVCFPSVYENLKTPLKKDTVYKMTGKIQLKEDKRQLIVESLKRLNIS